MYCKHCGKEISDDAKFCDGCGKSLTVASASDDPKKKKKKKKHPILGTIIIIIGIFMFIGAFGSSNEPQKVSSSSPAAVSDATEPPVYTVGDTLEMGNILVTMNNVSENTGSQFLAPTDGNVFVVCEFTIENNSDSEMAVSSLMSFECYFDDYAANLSLGATTSADGKAQLDGSVAPGKKINGVVGYEAPRDWTEMEIHFKSNVYSSKPFVFNYSK